MADNVTADPGTGGATFAADDAAGVYHPYTKMEWGANDTQTPVASGASALPIQDGGNSITVDNAVLGASATFDHGSNRDVDTAAEQVTTSSIAAARGVWVMNSPASTAIVYVGNSDVTADTTAATDGWPLSPGKECFVPVNNANLVYVIAAAANQIVFWRTE